MNTTPVIAFLLAVLGCAAAVPASLAPAQAASRDQAALNDFAQAKPRPARARTRITVRPPIYPYRTYSTTYPVPYPIEYPGPGMVRECNARLVQEYRPSGTVIVPVTSCQWVRQ
jgi:hypothetical protein